MSKTFNLLLMMSILFTLGCAQTMASKSKENRSISSVKSVYPAESKRIISWLVRFDLRVNRTNCKARDLRGYTCTIFMKREDLKRLTGSDLIVEDGIIYDIEYGSVTDSKNTSKEIPHHYDTQDNFDINVNNGDDVSISVYLTKKPPANSPYRAVFYKKVKFLM